MGENTEMGSFSVILLLWEVNTTMAIIVGVYRVRL
jgi:hypothetical protein